MRTLKIDLRKLAAQYGLELTDALIAWDGGTDHRTDEVRLEIAGEPLSEGRRNA